MKTPLLTDMVEAAPVVAGLAEEVVLAAVVAGVVGAWEVVGSEGVEVAGGPAAVVAPLI